MKTKLSVRLAALAALSIFASSCATMKPTVSAALANPDQLQAVDDKGTLAYRRAAQPGVRYTVPEVRPVVITAEALAEAKLPPETVDALTKSLEETLARTLSERWPQAGPSTGAENRVRLETRVTDLNLSNGKLNALTILALGLPVDPGGIVVELEAFDMNSGERIAARIAGRGGRPFNLLSSLRRTGQAEMGFRKIAESFTDDLVSDLTPDAVNQRSKVAP